MNPPTAREAAILRRQPYPAEAMDAREFLAVLAYLNWTRPNLRLALGISERVATEFGSGRRRIPGPVAEALRAAVRGERPPPGWRFVPIEETTT